MAMETTKLTEPIRLFISYSHEDEHMRKQLVEHLGILDFQGLTEGWDDHHIVPGSEWEAVIDERLNSANIIVLLISSKYFSSKPCKSEMKRAMERHKADEARVIPVLLSDCDWRNAPFAGLQMLPEYARPIDEWDNSNKAFANVARGIHRAVEELLRSNP